MQENYFRLIAFFSHELDSFYYEKKYRLAGKWEKSARKNLYFLAFELLYTMFEDLLISHSKLNKNLCY